MEAEYLILNHDDCIAIVYKHETLGRIVVIRGTIDPEYKLIIHNVKDGMPREQNMMEFLLNILPREDEPKK